MIWHATGKCTEPGKMQHPADGRAWKKFDIMYPDFVKEPRNVRLRLAADGFNPFGNLSQAYSMWPVILTTYNLPPWLCMKENSFMLTLLIPGPKSSGKYIDVYLRPLIEDLKDDMLKAQIKVVDILGDLELIYPPALFDIMIHLVIHLPLEALEGGPIRPRPEIDTYRSQFKSLFLNKDMKEEFPDWFGSQIRQRHVDNDKDPEVSTTSELFALACGPTWTPISVNSCVVDGVSLNDLDNAILHIDGQSTEVNALLDIFDVPDEDDYIIDDEDALHYDFADFDDEDLINVDDDGDDKRQSSATQEYPSLIDTFFVAHTVNGVFIRDEDRLIYRGHIPSVGRVLPARVTAGPSRPAPESTLKSLHKKVDFMMRLFKSDSKYSDAFSQFELAGASRSGGSDGCGDDKESADDQEDEDEDGDGDS
nr:hypothetical protein [Tanacetum cinerariifolium]